MKSNRLVVGALLALSGCAAAPQPVVYDKLDAVTGATLTVLTKPMELLIPPEQRGDRRVEFAYLAPFEIDQMGARRLYLWVLAPNDIPASSPPVIRCDGERTVLPAPARGPSEIGLNDLPYAPPYSWSTQWYFPLTDAALACLARAHIVALEIPNAAAPPTVFLVRSNEATTAFTALQSLIGDRGH